MSESAFSHDQPRAAAEGVAQCGPSPDSCALSSSGRDLGGPPQQFHGHTLVSLHGTGVVGTSELQQERTWEHGGNTVGQGVPCLPCHHLWLDNLTLGWQLVNCFSLLVA